MLVVAGGVVVVVVVRGVVVVVCGVVVVVVAVVVVVLVVEGGGGQYDRSALVARWILSSRKSTLTGAAAGVHEPTISIDASPDQSVVSQRRPCASVVEAVPAGNGFTEPAATPVTVKQTFAPWIAVLSMSTEVAVQTCESRSAPVGPLDEQSTERV